MSEILRELFGDLLLDSLAVTGDGLAGGETGGVAGTIGGFQRCRAWRAKADLPSQGEGEEEEEQDKDLVLKRIADACTSWAKLRNPNLTQLLGVGFPGSAVTVTTPTEVAGPQAGDAGALFVATELLPVDLESCLKQHSQIPVSIRSSILLDVSLAVLYLHRQSPVVCGLDFSPENIWLTPGLRAKLHDPLRVTAAREESDSQRSDVVSLGNLILKVAVKEVPPQTNGEPECEGESAGSPQSSSVLLQILVQQVGENHPLVAAANKCLSCPGEEEAALACLTSAVAELQSAVAMDGNADNDPFAHMLQMSGAFPDKTPTRKPSERSEAEVPEYRSSPSGSHGSDVSKQKPEDADGTAVAVEDLQAKLSALNQVVGLKEKEMEAQQEASQLQLEEIKAKDQAMGAQLEQIETYKTLLKEKDTELRYQQQAVRSKHGQLQAKSNEMSYKNKEIAAKDNLLKAASARIKVLEHEVQLMKEIRAKGDVASSPSSSKSHTPPSSTPPLSKQPSCSEEEQPVREPEVVVMRAKRGRGFGRHATVSDGLFYQNWQKKIGEGQSKEQAVDPKLTSLLQKQLRKIDESQPAQAKPETQTQAKPEAQATGAAAGTSDSDPGASEGSQGTVLRHPNRTTGREPLPELQKKLTKRRSLIEFLEENYN